MKSAFFDKLIDKLDRLDPKSLQSHFLRLIQERGLLETIFQSIQEGVIVIDGMGRITYSNKATESLLGIAMDDIKGRHISRYIKEIDWDNILKLDEDEWSKLISHEIEVAYPERRIINFYIVPLFTKKITEQGAVLILRDVTRDRFQEANVVESEKINAIKLLAAGVAHEIGNPLNALNIHLQLLDRELSQIIKGCDTGTEPDKNTIESLKGLLGVSRKEVSRLDAIISQFLKAIRPARPELKLDSVHEVLKETLTLLEEDIRNRKINVEIRSKEQIPNILIDRDQLKQVFFNIIKNAMQAMPDGGMLIVALGITDQFIAVSFKDSGTGIKEEDLGHIFDPYFTTKKEGSGLGLMIVQRIVQDHGGFIKVSSKHGEGTDFTVLLPLAERRMRLLPKAPAE